MNRLTGEWEVVITSMMGEERAIWCLDAENADITGSLKDFVSGQEVGTVVETLKNSGDEFGFKTVLKLPFGVMPFTMEGKVEGDTITGTATMPMGQAKLTGNRK